MEYNTKQRNQKYYDLSCNVISVYSYVNSNRVLELTEKLKSRLDNKLKKIENPTWFEGWGFYLDLGEDTSTSGKSWK